MAARSKGAPVVSLDVAGDKQLRELFDQLKRSQQKSIQISAFRAAAKPLIADAKSNLSARTKKRSGNLLRSLGSAPLRNLPILKIGARAFGSWAGYHGHLVDQGSDGRMFNHTKSGAEHKTGAMPATKFWSDSVDRNERGMVDGIQRGIVQSFDKYIVKYNNKAKT